jgi:hypothetical protein
MSNLPKGTPCYALLWEGVIGSFYKIDSQLTLIKLADVMPEPGHRYALLFGFADPTFDKSVAEFSRFSDAGKLMALASFSKRSKPSDEEAHPPSPGAPSRGGGSIRPSTDRQSSKTSG